MPITRLSKANIRRAARSFRRLKKRGRVRNRRKYIFGTAWKIQRARRRKYGHR